VRREDERLDDAWDRPAYQPEVDAVEAAEPDGLHGRRRQPSAHGREVRGEDHVVAAFQYTDLLQRGAGGPPEIRLGHDAEHDVA